MSSVSMPDDALLLAIDTCGITGSVALGTLAGESIIPLSQRIVPGGEFASGLIPAIEDLLRERELNPTNLAGIIVVAGPGSFTGIRIGLATAKSFAAALTIPIVTLSRLELLAHLAQSPCAVLDAHRGQVFCGFYDSGLRELLVTAGEINAMGGLHGRVAVCEETVVHLLEELQGAPEIVRLPQPLAADALAFSIRLWQAQDYADLATLDGHYLRGADAKPSTRPL
jgi:tRNA threonylcarbamoyladenosine biosynthesis protein TsaB